MEKVKQHEQVIEVMRENGGFATLGFLNQKVNTSLWKTKTPFASIRRIVQDERFFFKIRPGLWALKEEKENVLAHFEIEQPTQKQELFTHSYFQGLLVEIGNLKGLKTFVPNQDKNQMFLQKRLSDISTLENIYDFTYPKILKRAKTIDVVWFNDRNFPHAFFEVEHSTDIQNSLLKYYDLQDFYSQFFIVSDRKRKKEFEQKIGYHAFKSISNRVQFLDYEYVSTLHSKIFELARLEDLHRKII